MFADARRGYPMTFVLEVHMTGKICREALETAVEVARSRHPMLQARINARRFRRPMWTEAGELRPTIDWTPLDSPAPRGCEPIDLRKSLGLRVWVRHDERQAAIALEFHHCCLDGLGGVQFIGDLLASYEQQLNPSTKVEFSSLDPSRLSGRGVFAVRLPAPVSRLEVVRSSVAEAVKWFRHRPVPVAAPEQSTAHENALPEYCHYQFSEEESRRIRETAMRHSVTVNDLLLRDMFLTVKAWNARYRPHAKAEWLRINMPTSLRGHNENSMPAANRMSFAFLTRNERDCDAGDAFLAGIRWETKMIQRWSLGHLFLNALQFGQCVPGLLKFILAGRSCLASVILSNLGEVSRHFTTVLPTEARKMISGNLTVEKVLGAPPLRPGTRVSMALFACSNRLLLCLACDRKQFTPQRSEEFLSLFVRHVRQSIAAPTELPQPARLN
jgi:hypothetical protein